MEFFSLVSGALSWYSIRLMLFTSSASSFVSITHSDTRQSDPTAQTHRRASFVLSELETMPMKMAKASAPSPASLTLPPASQRDPWANHQRLCSLVLLLEGVWWRRAAERHYGFIHHQIWTFHAHLHHFSRSLLCVLLLHLYTFSILLLCSETNRKWDETSVTRLNLEVGFPSNSKQELCELTCCLISIFWLIMTGCAALSWWAAWSMNPHHITASVTPEGLIVDSFDWFHSFLTRQSKLYEQTRVCEYCGLSQISGLFSIKKAFCNIEPMFSDESGPVSLTASAAASRTRAG